MDKSIEFTEQSIGTRLDDIQASLESFTYRLQYENLQWPTVLDNFALIAGQMSMLNNHLRNEKLPQLHNLILLPLTISQETDSNLQEITKNRIQTFDHEIVPDYLRTKPEPEVERDQKELAEKADMLSEGEKEKEVTDANVLIDDLIEIINNARTAWNIHDLFD
ncbi:Mediator of RNA polymerase II transcription subunit 8 [Trichoplax sp. H2]|uniref:Mediator of RNA polymerase II transcription subunit 8 n=1 Tax=Trichoplax adhaerens TaxID=10228 RepID=B3RME7_TRIAD|nr:hypothetical protein TRIADDRAFT_53928 [Trichoplax adhaerens]EDV28353.1 hypothetical protein TRIADDRAFT_53928 [Trichoplax adhaerens]RDD41565.1 Mediator of RNA polymerase II transcription subunit 8 [Trichoplax sp. H2]|eukprot:XP_002110187.1 hypothetical protein TRIADDRAFT_53928 [Trichoplax adhaerens]